MTLQKIQGATGDEIDGGDTVLNRPTVQVGRALHVTQPTVRLGSSSDGLVTRYGELFAGPKTEKMAHAHL